MNVSQLNQLPATLQLMVLLKGLIAGQILFAPFLFIDKVKTLHWSFQVYC
jgi:hypothetical protein